MAQVATRAEFVFTKDDFRYLAALVQAKTGMVLPETKAALVYSRLSRRLRGLGLKCFSDYCALLAEGNEVEQDVLVRAMTTNIASFFHEPNHFQHLRETVLPALIARARAGGCVRLWSAACSSGEEAWSIALTLLAAMPDAPDRDVLVLASDVDPAMLAQAKAGRYPLTALETIPASLRGAVRRTENGFGFCGAAHALLRFKCLDLVGVWPVQGFFDVVFCRGVAVYFNTESQTQMWARFAACMKAGAHLYVGHGERVASPDFMPAGRAVYQRVTP